MKFIHRHFGKISALLLLLLILLINLLGYNVSSLNLYLAINGYLYIGVIFLFFLLLYYSAYRKNEVFKICFWILLFNTQALIITKTLEAVRISNDRSDISMMDRSAALDMSWIISTPIVFVSCVLLGVLFDLIIKRSSNNSKNDNDQR